MRRLATAISFLILSACTIAAQPAPQIARRAEWILAPGPWTVTETVVVPGRAGAAWRVRTSVRPLGYLAGERGEVMVELPRVEFQRVTGRDDTVTVAVALPVDNRDMGIFPPGSPEESAVPSEPGEDPFGRWPNACGISILDATGALDPDGDGSPEIALRRFCSCTAPACAGIVLVSLRPRGPVILDPASLVPDIRLGRVVLEEILPDSDAARPIFRIAPDLLEECRMIAALAIPGKNECAECCRFPVLLRAAAGGSYEPYYDRHRQSAWLERAKNDVAFAAAGDPARPLRSVEQAQVARAAAFFYLTGSGAATRKVIADGLGVRARDFRSQELLRRIERYFLAAPPGSGSGSR